MMQQKKWGRIINITGTTEPRGITGSSAAKARYITGQRVYVDGGMHYAV